MQRPRDERGRFVAQRRVPEPPPYVWTRRMYAAPAPAPPARRRVLRVPSQLAWLYAAEAVAVVGLVTLAIYGASQ